MEINFINLTADEDVTAEGTLYKAQEIAYSTAQRLMKENPDKKITGAFTTDITYKIAFKIEGQEELQELTVEHHPGVVEPFKWIVDYKEDKETSNQDASFMDAWTASVVKGKELQFDTVESVYKDVEMELLDSVTYGNMSKDTWKHPDGFNVVMVYQDERLIQEYKLTPKETE